MHSVSSPNSKTSQEQSELWSSKALAPESSATCVQLRDSDSISPLFSLHRSFHPKPAFQSALWPTTIFSEHVASQHLERKPTASVVHVCLYLCICFSNSDI